MTNSIVDLSGDSIPVASVISLITYETSRDQSLTSPYFPESVDPLSIDVDPPTSGLTVV